MDKHTYDYEWLISTLNANNSEWADLVHIDYVESIKEEVLENLMHLGLIRTERIKNKNENNSQVDNFSASNNIINAERILSTQVAIKTEPSRHYDPKTFEASRKFDLNHLFELYPRTQKKSLSLQCLAVFFSGRDAQSLYPRLEAAIKNYKAFCEREKTLFTHILTLPNFLKEWHDWEDPQNGTSRLQNKDKSFLEFMREKKERNDAK